VSVEVADLLLTEAVTSLLKGKGALGMEVLALQRLPAVAKLLEHHYGGGVKSFVQKRPDLFQLDTSKASMVVKLRPGTLAEDDPWGDDDDDLDDPDEWVDEMGEDYEPGDESPEVAPAASWEDPPEDRELDEWEQEASSDDES
jgi:hypothetical protein